MRKFYGLVLITVLAGCASTTPTAQCDVTIRAPLEGAMLMVEDRLTNGCAYSFDAYMAQLIEVARDNPAAGNKRAFSELLVRISDQAVISKRQASEFYNRYFNIKFASLSGDYNTCSQVCPVRSKVISQMRDELRDKEVGLLEITGDQGSYYRADHLLQESELVLEATCRACDGDAG
ncbi:MAG: hypothetical protein O2780_11925 [Proteobacteria bacterium]|jgi:hypothetical protein|nr:hypothetical protein [Pseudomonadota bacterium]MDA1300786.1 hypothetical protein [Pseudomonadota bacterium]